MVLPIEGESRAAGESWEIKETQIDLFQNPAGLFGLEQIFEPATVPVRRIDDIVLCAIRTGPTSRAVAPRQFGGGKPAAPPTTGQPKSPPPSGGDRAGRRRASGKTPNGVDHPSLHRRDRPGAADAAGHRAYRRSSAHPGSRDRPVQFPATLADHPGQLAALPRHLEG